jgi:hypothetical protein
MNTGRRIVGAVNGDSPMTVFSSKTVSMLVVRKDMREHRYYSGSS